MAATSTGPPPTGPTVRGYAITDLSALLGGLVWLAAATIGGLDLIERALALAPLVLVPLGVGMAGPFEGTAERLRRGAVLIQPVGALFLVASLLFPGALLAAGWLPVTGLLALAALARVRARGLRPIPELAIDAGFAYPTVAAVALVLWQSGVFLWFEPVIVLLTAVHFHYAGFVLPLVAGLSGRTLGSRVSDGFRAIVAVITVGPGIIAVGISFSPLVEILAVGVFTLAVTLFAGFVLFRVVPTRPRRQGVLLALSALALPISMLLALGYGVTAFTGSAVGELDISTMVRLHGQLNAFGFALLALVGWRLAVPVSDDG